MAQEGYDTLIALTDSRYRLSMIVARRAAQLKAGIPSTLEPGILPDTDNSVTVAMKELELSGDIRWGTDLPEVMEVRRITDSARSEPSSALQADEGS